MNRSVISSIALAGAMLLSTAAFSQTVIDGNTISAEDLPKVQAACDTLAAKDATATSSATTNANATTTASNEATSSTDSTAGATDAGTSAVTVTSIDLALLTVEKCKEAGLVKTP